MAANIHPIWPIDEYAIILRNSVWFSPPAAPTNPLVVALIVRAIDDDMYDINIKGASFCHVISNIQFFHLIPSITPGNQKWTGAAPAFISKATVIIINDTVFVCIDFVSVSMAAMTNVADADAWMMKYFIADSECRWFSVLNNSGINDNKLISIPIHALNHDDDEILMRVPITRVTVNRIFDNFMLIRIENYYSISGVWAQ